MEKTTIKNRRNFLKGLASLPLVGIFASTRGAAKTDVGIVPTFVDEFQDKATDICFYTLDEAEKEDILPPGVTVRIREDFHPLRRNMELNFISDPDRKFQPIPAYDWNEVCTWRGGDFYPSVCWPPFDQIQDFQPDEWAQRVCESMPEWERRGFDVVTLWGHPIVAILHEDEKK